MDNKEGDAPEGGKPSPDLDEETVSVDMSELTPNSGDVPAVSAVGRTTTASSSPGATESSPDDPAGSSRGTETQRTTTEGGKEPVESDKEDPNQEEEKKPSSPSPQSSTQGDATATRGRPIPAQPRIPRSATPPRSHPTPKGSGGDLSEQSLKDVSTNDAADPAPTLPESPYKVGRPLVTGPTTSQFSDNDDDESIGGDSPTQSQVSASSRKSYGRMSLAAPVRPSKFATKPSHVNITRSSDTIDNSLIGVVEGRAPRSEREKQYMRGKGHPEVSDVGVDKLDKNNKSAWSKTKGILTLLLKLGVVASFVAFAIFINLNFSEGSAPSSSEGGLSASSSAKSGTDTPKSGLLNALISDKNQFNKGVTKHELNTARTGEEPADDLLTSDGLTDDAVGKSELDDLHLTTHVSHHHHQQQPTSKPSRKGSVIHKVQSIILRHKISLPESFNLRSKPASPQMNALLWLAQSDSYEAAAESRDDVEHIKLLQRYALGVFFFSLGGSHQQPIPLEEEEGMNQLETDPREIHIFQREEEQKVDNKSQQQSWRHKSNWISQRSVCRWFGVTCDADELVVSLNLTNNGLRGSIPMLELFQTLRETLKSLDVSHNAIKGSLALPPEIRTRAWLKLEHFIVNDNEITGPAHFDWFEISSSTSSSPLLGINMARNLLSGLPNSRISNLEALKELYLSYNVLVGSLPQMTNLPSLRILHLNDNAFRGTIPEELFQLTSLVDFRAGNNELTGFVPIDLPLLHDLEILSLEENHIQGHIPDHFVSVSNLRYLNLSNNELSGTLPYTLANATHIEKISLEHNSLSGMFPKSFAALTKLQCLLLDHNDIYGHIPKEFCKLKAGFFHLNRLKRVEMDCRHEISCECCDKCH